MAIKSNITIDQGTDYEVTINVRDANTTAISLTGFTGLAQLRKYYTSSRKYDFGVTVSANTGEVTMSMSAANTANIAAGRYVYDCVLISNTNVVSRIVEGIVTINPRVSR
ncbi:hypothetical protein UFOVP447_74 [uncultured Caudovirales phage]|uniref:BppU N-terminal domain-containing protein n=1 Tax=uncultured Caudovirales phage TaxID=2100421 RepID=A0A6J5MBF8_9CAUD|nr:hypothetical protein UFOVP447_74 [uncultured Caudovirales phage]